MPHSWSWGCYDRAMIKGKISRVTLILGSDLGDREANLNIAKSLIITELASYLFSDITETEVIESQAWGFESQKLFLNQAISFLTTVTPEQMLSVCKWVEQKMGRAEHQAQYDSDGKRVYSSRIIDIDIVLFADVVMNTPELTIPHPQIREREYAVKLISRMKELLRGELIIP